MAEQSQIQVLSLFHQPSQADGHTRLKHSFCAEIVISRPELREQSAVGFGHEMRRRAGAKNLSYFGTNSNHKRGQ